MDDSVDEAGNRCRKAAPHYARAGWPAFPAYSVRDGRCTCGNATCKDPGKHPATRNGFKDATTDEVVLEALFRTVPNANVALRTGVVSWALDVDVTKGGDDSLAELERVHGPMPDTVTNRTGGGGLHYLFRWDARRPVPSSVGILPGIDVRGLDAYIIAPPSQHKSGQSYQYLIGHGPHEIGLALAPPWLLELVMNPPRASRVRHDGTRLVLQEGKRNDGLFRIACLLRRIGFNANTIGASLAAANRNHCVPPLADSEVTKIARSATRYPASQQDGRARHTDDDEVIAALLRARR